MAESSIVALKLTKIMMRQKIWNILNQVPKPLIKVTLAEKLIEGRKHKS